MGWATLNGIVLDAGGAGCEARFQLGPTPAMGVFTPWQGASLLVTGSSFSQAVIGLSGGTIYYFQAEVRNIFGSVTGSMLSFQTSLNGGESFTPPGSGAPVPFPFPGGLTGVGSGPLPPSVAIMPPTGIVNNQMNLNGLVTFQGDLPGSVRFQWGVTADYGADTPWQDGFGTGSTFSALITGLGAGNAYHCRAEFKNSHGPSVFSQDLTFSTLSETGGMLLSGDDILILGGER